MPTGETGRPGLPGLPGSYTVQVPHNVQKREAGVCLLCAAKSLRKRLGLNAHVTEPCRLFSPSVSGRELVGRRKRDRRQAGRG